MAFPTILSFVATSATGAATTVYVPVPVRCIVKDCQASVSADPGDAETVTLADGSTTLGVLTFGSDIAAGATGTYVADSDGGETVLDAGDVIKVTITQCTAAAVFTGYIEIDPFVRTTQ